MSRKRVRVRCIETGDVFRSITEASLYYKISMAAISRHLHGSLKSCGGLTFEEVSEDITLARYSRDLYYIVELDFESYYPESIATRLGCDMETVLWAVETPGGRKVNGKYTVKLMR